MSRRPAVLCCALVLLAGCSSKAATTPLPSPSASLAATPIPAAYTLRSDAAQGYSLAIPDAWDYVLRDSPSFDADLQTVSQHSPELAAYFQQSFASDGQVRMLGADSRSLATGFAANVQVMVSDLGPVASAPSLKDLGAAKLKLLGKQTTVAQPVKRTDGHLSGQAAERLDYALTGATSNPVVRSFLAVVERDGRSYEYELTMGALPDAAGTTFENLGRLFTLFTPAAGTPRPSAPAGSSPGVSPSRSASASPQ
ncbi:MAG TPA: hypothetical protein VGR61_03135 [Candidatus Dormibacteraeota bacterium]|nr:hypothetical protein [Candidatus Dormibacteraeota bacterium]